MPQHQLFNKIFQQDINKSGSLAFMEDLKKEYPYFSAAHYFLLMQTESSAPAYEQIAAATSLHFTNPFLLNQRLVKKNDPIISTPPVKIPEPEEKLQESPKEETVTVIPEEIVNGNVDITETLKEKKGEHLIFEPLYTTDYFASQGIKLSEEVQPADKLGKQLKSFTEWLKTMKKVHEGKLPQGNEQLDTSVQQLAEKSNREDEIVTESMAEVYLQQGKKDKAIDIYKKLSLLNPAKSAFFAAKIENLKEK